MLLRRLSLLCLAAALAGCGAESPVPAAVAPSATAAPAPSATVAPSPAPSATAAPSPSATAAATTEPTSIPTATGAPPTRAPAGTRTAAPTGAAPIATAEPTAEISATAETAAPTEQPAIDPAPPALDLADQAAALLPATQGDLGAAGRWDRYSIDVALDPAARTASGALRVDVTNRAGQPLPEIYFHLYPNHPDYRGSLSVDDVLVNGQPAAISTAQGDIVLKVGLPQPLAPDATAAISMRFSARTPRGASGNGYGAFNQEAGVWALATFYPVLVPIKGGEWQLAPVSSRGDFTVTDVALYDVRVDAPDGWQIASTGARVSSEPLAAGARRERFVSGPQRDFMLTALSGLEQASGEVDGTRIVSYYQPGNAEAGARALEAAQQAVRIFNERFGRYPLAELEVVQAALTTFLGVEYPGIVLIEQRLYQGRNGLSTTVAHEVAHQWWYSQVGNDAQRNPWLDEGLASYSQIVYREGIGDAEGASSELQGFRDTYARAREQGRDGASQRPATQFSGNYVALAYAKPALFLQALRNRIGDDAFFRGIQTYYAANRYGDNASGDRLVEAMDGACGCATRDLYEAWVLGNGPVEIP